MLSAKAGKVTVAIFLLSLCNGSIEGYNEETAKSDLETLYSEISAFQNLFSRKPSAENVSEIFQELSSTLQVVVHELVQAYFFQKNVTTEISKLKADINETKCSFSMRLIDIENGMAKAAVATTEPEEAPIVTSSTRRASARPGLTSENFFMTPATTYSEARKYCRSHNADPFVPKSEMEFKYIVRRVTKDFEYGWVPLHDIISEGFPEWDDGTAYEDGVNMQFSDNDENNGNTPGFDCVDINNKGLGDWYDCYKSRPMLCLDRNFDA